MTISGGDMRKTAMAMAFAAILAVPLASDLGAQRLPEPRITPFAAPVTDTVPKTGRQPLPPGFVTQQAVAGFGGLAVGGLLGGMVGSALVQDGGNGWEDLAGLVVGMAVGGAVGSSVAVYRFSNAKGYRSSYAATLLGSVVGFSGGPVFWVTVPIGSAVGYNVARK
jgi:hypothetical protein